MTVDVVIAVHQLLAVNHPLNTYPLLLGLLGSVHNAVLYVTALLVGLCPLPEFPLKVTVYCLGALQLALLHPFAPLQLHVNVPALLVTADAFHAQHKFALGAVKVAVPFDVQHVQFIICVHWA